MIINKKDVAYEGTDFEIRIMSKYWESYLKDKKKLHTARGILCKELEQDEVVKIDQIINRMNHFIVDKSEDTDIFSAFEKETIAEMEADLSENIKNYEGYYQYKKYKLRENRFEPGIFYYQFGLENFFPCFRNRDIVDAGAYIGDSAVVLSGYTDRSVYAFEPYQESYEKISENAKLNGLTNIIPVNSALGDKDEDVVFYVRENVASGHGVVKRNELEYQSECKVAQITLDEFAEQNGLDVGLIKVDIEGAERKLIQGARSTIQTAKPVIALSIYHTADDFFELKNIVEEISGNGNYSFRVFNPLTRYAFFLETTLICIPTV